MGAEFDALLGGLSFKTASDGSRLFFPLSVLFPWILDRGYVIASERDYQRLRRQIKIYLTIFLYFGAGVLLPFIGVGNTHVSLSVAVISVLLMGFYGVRALSLSRRLQPSNDNNPDAAGPLAAGFNFNVEEWDAKGLTYETLAICRSIEV